MAKLTGFVKIQYLEKILQKLVSKETLICDHSCQW
jgi:hypothetical protein